MENPSLYKKISLNQARQRATYTLSDEERSEVNNTISVFFELFAAKHL